MRSKTTLARLDHLAVIAQDLEPLAEAYNRMGFHLTAYSRHAGSPIPGAPPVLMGTANRCAMFREGYLELIGAVQPVSRRPSRLVSVKSAISIAPRSPDIDSSQRCRGRVSRIEVPQRSVRMWVRDRSGRPHCSTHYLGEKRATVRGTGRAALCPSRYRFWRRVHL